MKRIVSLLIILTLVLTVFVGCNKDDQTTGTTTTPAPAAPTAKDYSLVVVTDSSIKNLKVTNYMLALVTDANGKIVAARFDCAEMTPALDTEGAVVPQNSVATKVELGDSYSGMPAGSFAKQAKAFEDSIVGKTAAEVAALDLSLVAGCTMQSTTPVFQSLVAKAYASTLKVSFSTADAFTLGANIDSKVASGKGGKVSAASDFAGVVMVGGKVAATMIDSCEQSFTIAEGALVAPETPAVSKNDQGESYSGMPAGAWYKQAQAFANSTVGKTAAALENLETVSDALATAGCTMKNTTAGYKTTIIGAVAAAR